MIDTETLSSRIGNLRGYLEKLTTLAVVSKEEFLREFTYIESAKHLLQVSIESCLDIAHHIVAEEGYRTPTDYYDTFVVLYENKILPENFMPSLRQMVGFRNRLVHLYWDVGSEAIYQILQENLGDFEVFVKLILDSFKP